MAGLASAVALSGRRVSISNDQRSLRERVSEFIAHEADLADARAYDEWLKLWSPDAVYWVPCNLDDYDPRRHVSIIYDDYQRLKERCFRLSSEGAHAQEPPSRLCRVMGHVDVAVEDGSRRIIAKTKMVLVEVRSGAKNIYGARCEYRLEETEDAFAMLSKKVILVENDEPLGNLTFIL